MALTISHGSKIHPHGLSKPGKERIQQRQYYYYLVRFVKAIRKLDLRDINEIEIFNTILSWEVFPGKRSL